MDDKESWFHSMELFSNELMPALNRAVGTTAPAGTCLSGCFSKPQDVV